MQDLCVYMDELAGWLTTWEREFSPTAALRLANLYRGAQLHLASQVDRIAEHWHICTAGMAKRARLISQPLPLRI